MRTCAPKKRTAQQTKPAKSASSSRAFSGQNRDTHSIFGLERTIENQAVQRLLQSNDEQPHANATLPVSSRFGHDFSRIPVYHQVPADEGTGTSTILNMIQTNGMRELRTRVSRVTGIDVGSVPVEMGDTHGKRAVTHEGCVTLGAKATEHDIVHELAHAAQQRSSSGAWLGPGEAERRAVDVAAVVLSRANVLLPVGRVPGAAILGAGDPYSREALMLKPPPKGLKTRDFEAQLKAKITAGEITGYALAGVKPGDPEEKFLYNALIQLANKKRWGSELDLITSVGAGKGLVTVRFNAAGKAEARLVGKSAPAVPKAFSKIRDAADALVKKYKLAGVKGEKGRNWKIDELNKVLAAWGRLSSGEAVALEGYTLIRTDRLILYGESVQGMTTHTDEVKKGKTKVTHLREIRFADSAFTADDKSFIGDAVDAAPASFEVMIHEVGHALEAKPFDDLNVPAAEDAAKANKAKIDAHAAQVKTNKAINAALKGQYPKKDIATGQPLFTAVSKTQKILQKLEASPDANHETMAKKAIADRDTVKAKIPTGNKVMTGLEFAISNQNAYLAALQKFYAATMVALASRAKADALKSGSNTKRLQNFVDFVTKEKIPPPTAYARKHWPGKPAEFFNEAFSLWKNDPIFFAKYSPKLKKWFDAGNHLK